MIKKFLSFVMALAMCFSLAATAFAAQTATDRSEESPQTPYGMNLIDFGTSGYAAGFNLASSSVMATNDTCSLYGTHKYALVGQPASKHPHEQQWKCKCGATRTTLTLKFLCSSCTANSKTATSSTLKKGVLSFVDSDQGLGAAVFVPVDLYVKYTNTYNNPLQNHVTWANSGLPPFASSTSKVYYSVENVVGFAPSVIVVASRTVEYYKSSGSSLATQTMSWNSQNEAIPTAGQYYVLSEKPSYTICSATCSLSGNPGSFVGTTKTTF